MIDLKSETLIRLWPDAAKHLPAARRGKPRSKSSMYRLKNQGLEICVISGILYTSVESLHRLIERQTCEVENTPPVPRKNSEKRRAIKREQAKFRLRGHGVD